MKNLFIKLKLFVLRLVYPGRLFLPFDKGTIYLRVDHVRKAHTDFRDGDHCSLSEAVRAATVPKADWVMAAVDDVYIDGIKYSVDNPTHELPSMFKSGYGKRDWMKDQEIASDPRVPGETILRTINLIKQGKA